MKMWNNYHIVVVSGYAQSGKTKFIEKMVEKYDFHKISSSDALHTFTQLLFWQIFDIDVNTHEIKNEKLNFLLERSINKLVGNKLLGRDLLIKLAENVLKPVFGNDIFVKYQIKEAHQKLSENKKIIIETIGGDEFNLLLKAVSNTWACYPNAVAFVNLRSKNELPNVDMRTLIDGAYELWDTQIDDI